MKSNTMPVAKPRTDAEYQQEADRLAREIRTMLDETKCSRERGDRITAKTKAIRDHLRKQILCGND